MPYIGNQHNVGDHVNNFKVLDDISSYTATFNGSATSVVSAADDTIRIPEHRFIQGQRVTYTNGGGGNIGGLTTGTAYFVSFDSANTIKLATTLANANSNTVINLSSVGSGSSHTLNAAFDGINTKFKLTHSGGKSARLNNATQINVAINNVIQRPNRSSLSFTEGFAIEDNHKIVFKVAPTVNDIFWGSIIANTIENFDLRDNEVDNFTGDGSTTEFTLSTIPANNESVMVSLDGVLQHPSDKDTSRSYTLLDSIIQFTAAPGNGVEIQVRHIGFAGASTNDVSGFYGRSGNVTLTANDHITTGDITSRNINSSGIITATSFVGSGANLTGIDATAVKDASGNVKIQAQASGAIYTGIHTFTTLKSSSGDFSGNVSIGGTLTYEDVTNIDSVGIITARDGIDCNGDIDVDGHTNLDNVNIAGVTTTGGNLFVGGNIEIPSSGKSIKIWTGGTQGIIINHGGTYGVIDNLTGTMRISAGQIKLLNRFGNLDMLTCNSFGSVDLFHNNILRFTTTGYGVSTTGLEVVGVSTFSGDVDVNANIYGRNLILDGNNGIKYIDADLANGNSISLRGYVGGSYQFLADFTRGGACGFNFSGNRRLETTSTGVKITSNSGDISVVTDSTGSALSLINPQNVNNSDVKFGSNYGHFSVFTGGSSGSEKFAVRHDANVRIPNDNAKLQIGASQDLQLYHDGSHSFVENTTGLLILQDTSGIYLRTDDLRLQSSGGSETYATLTKDGAVALNFDNSQKFTTTSTGATVNGSLTVTGNIVLGDSGGASDDRLVFGAGTDLSIFHNGNHSKILNVTGELRLDGNSIKLKNEDEDENYITCTDTAGVELFYANTKKFETTSDGTTFSGSALFPDNQRIKIGGTASSPDLQLWHDSSNTYIQNSGTGYMVISTENGSTYYDADNHYFRKADSSEDMAKFFGDGGVELYSNNNKKLETYPSGIIVYGPEGQDGLLNLYADEGDDNADKWRLQADTNGSFYLKNYASGSWETNIATAGNGAVELYHDNVKKFETISTGVQVTGTGLALNVNGGYIRSVGGQPTVVAHKSSSTFCHIGVENNSNARAFLAYTNDKDFCIGRRSAYTGDHTGYNGVDITIDKTNHAVSLSYNGSTKLATSSAGVQITGALNVTTTMHIPDGSPGLQIGNSNDTRFYHSGSHSYIKHTGTGNFYVDVGANDYFSVTSEESETIIQAQSNGAVELFYNGSKKAETVTGGFTVTGDLTATGFVDSSSDIKLKTNIKTIDNALDKVLQLRGAEYDRIDRDNQHEIGVIAQEVEKIIPEVVHGEETKTVSYGNMVAVLIEAIKEQNEVINKMKKEIEDLKG